jgi:hypothetical protein
MTVARKQVRLMSLADIVARGRGDQELAPGFVARLRGADVEVTAVLRRTAVVPSLHDRWADKQVVLLADLLVDPRRSGGAEATTDRVLQGGDGSGTRRSSARRCGGRGITRRTRTESGTTPIAGRCRTAPLPSRDRGPTPRSRVRR